MALELLKKYVILIKAKKMKILKLRQIFLRTNQTGNIK